MSKGLTIPTIFTAVDKMSPSLRTMSNGFASFTQQAGAFSARSERMFRRLAPAIGEVQKQLLSMIGTGAAIGGAFRLGSFSADSIMNYEEAINSLQAVTGVSNLQLQQFKSEIEDLGRVSRKSNIDVAKSFETIGSNMSQYLEDPKGLRQITEAGITLSKAARTELEPTLNDLTSIMNQFGIKAQGAAKSVNILTAGEIVGSVRTRQVASMLQEFGATANSMNVSLAESTALIEALGLQMDKTKIGVGARNLLTIIGGAGGLDKKARKDLKHAGVDVKLLMDKTVDLSTKLHELSKIASDPIKMVSVFGRENLTTGQVIFNQLKTYDSFLAKIQNTNKAQEQAQTNSRGLRNSLVELENKWVNYITTSDKVSTGAIRLTNGINWLRENLDGVVDTTVTVIKYFAIWKAANLTLTALTTGFNVVLGIQTALVGASSMAMKGNTVALAAQSVAMRAMGVATALSTGNITALNAALGMTPFGWTVAGLAAIAGGIYLVKQRNEELLKQYEKKVQLDTVKNINRETEAVTALAAKYWHLGMGIKEATAAAIRLEAMRIDKQRFQSEQRIKETKAKLEKEKGKVYFGDLFAAFGIGPSEYGERGRLAQTLNAQQQSASRLAAEKLSLSQFAQSQSMAGNLNYSDVASSFTQRKVEYRPTGPFGEQYEAQQKAKEFRFYIQNDSGSDVGVKGEKKNFNVKPATTSTMVVK